MLKVVRNNKESNDNRGTSGSLLDEIVRDGARQMLTVALAVEVAAYGDQFADLVDEFGHRLVVRNGYHHKREIVTAAGSAPLSPKVQAREWPRSRWRSN
jgi:putative transposase